MTVDDVIKDLADEYRRLDGVLSRLTPDEWAAASGAPGWTVRDVVAHLALTEEGVAHTLSSTDVAGWRRLDLSVDDAVALQVEGNHEDPDSLLHRWRAACSAGITALLAADPNTRVEWAAAPLRPRTLATTRLAEHWAHGLDITEPLGIDFPDTDRLRHIAWLGHATIPYGCSLVNVEAQPVRVELVGPNGDPWTYGPTNAESTISGSAGAFCRVGAQRVAPTDSGLAASGPFGEQALQVLRNYAA